MASTRTVTCDVCGNVIKEGEREVGAQFTQDVVRFIIDSIDPTLPEKKSYRFRSVGWDLCVKDAERVYKAIGYVAAPRHDTLSEAFEEEED